MRASPMASRDLKHDESFFGHITEQMSRNAEPTSPKRVTSPQPSPLTDAQWKEHLAVKQIGEIDDVRAYARELAEEMRIYSLNRLENVQSNVVAILRRFRQLKPSRVGRRKRSRSQRAVTKTLDKSQDGKSPDQERSTSRNNVDPEQRPVLSKRLSEKGEQKITVSDAALQSEPAEPESPGTDKYTIPAETENGANKEGDESIIDDDSQLRQVSPTERLDNRYEKCDLDNSAVRKPPMTPVVPEPATAAMERVLNCTTQDEADQATNERAAEKGG